VHKGDDDDDDDDDNNNNNNNKRLHWYFIEFDVLITDAHRVLGKLRYSSLQ